MDFTAVVHRLIRSHSARNTTVLCAGRRHAGLSCGARVGVLLFSRTEPPFEVWSLAARRAAVC
jgi:hypothetical protein